MTIGSDDPGRRGRPTWWAALRPEPAVRDRLRERILAGAAPLLRASRSSWDEVAAGWSRALMPIAATLVLVFGALAWSVTSEHPGAGEATGPAAVADVPALPWEAAGLVELAEAELQVPPGPLLATQAPDADQILAAVLYGPGPEGANGR